MWTFSDFLAGEWHIATKGKIYSAQDIKKISYALAQQIITQIRKKNLPTQGLFVFFVSHNLEAMLCYFVASLLKIKILIVDIRYQHSVPELFSYESIAAYIYMKHHHKNLKNSKILEIDPYKETTHPAPFIEPITAYPCSYFFFRTSGTTGIPKIVQYKEEQLLKNAAEVRRYIGLNPRDKILCLFPVHYMYGLSTMLSSMGANACLIFENYRPETIREIVENYKVTVLPLIADWMFSTAHIFKASGTRVPKILNAADRLLTIQAEKILENCDILWNNFGQTESGPRIFCQALQSQQDIDKGSRYMVVAPGYPMTKDIKIKLIQSPNAPPSAPKKMYYQTPFAAEGYVDRFLQLTKFEKWIYSGDLFESDKSGRYYWVAREKNQIKINGQFVPIPLIANQIFREIGFLRHYFTKSKDDTLILTLEKSTNEESIHKIKEILADSWRKYKFIIKEQKQIATTITGKIKQTSRHFHRG